MDTIGLLPAETGTAAAAASSRTDSIHCVVSSLVPSPTLGQSRLHVLCSPRPARVSRSVSQGFHVSIIAISLKPGPTWPPDPWPTLCQCFDTINKQGIYKQCNLSPRLQPLHRSLFTHNNHSQSSIDCHSPPVLNRLSFYTNINKGAYM